MLQNLQKVAADRTIIMIAHRFAPLRKADLILVMEKGVVVERGTHDELVRKKGSYYALYERQKAAA